ncbi:MAG: hypothetical protein PWQ37_1764 [Candidatus Petromonas sp.]|jgi:flagellin-like hook-associated protein FlgL|nr:hypothetical protein [Candidatus Petromonas sp.]
MNNDFESKEYLEEKLKWVRYRLKMLNEIENKLKEMRNLAETAKINTLSPIEIEEINIKIEQLRNEVIELDKNSRALLSEWL